MSADDAYRITYEELADAVVAAMEDVAERVDVVKCGSIKTDQTYDIATTDDVAEWLTGAEVKGDVLHVIRSRMTKPAGE